MKGPFNILVVDDDSSIRTLARMCLETEGYVVQQASNGSEALERMHQNSPNLVLLDLAMPVMDGMTVLTETRSLLPLLRTRVVVMTAHGSIKTAMQALRLGASDFLEKPFTPQELRQSVASVLHDAPLHLPAPGGSYGEVLQAVRRALRDGQFASAEVGLIRAGAIADEDPAFLNLAGVLHESHGRIASALRFYTRALERNHRYLPAQENLQRLTELRRYGKSDRKTALGDHDGQNDVFGHQEDKATADGATIGGD